MPDLNWENPEVREAVYSMMRWWLDRGVDGFRMDVINMISKDPALPDAREPGAGMMPDGSEHFIDGPRIHEFLQEMHRSVFAGRPEPTLTVGEMPGVTVEEARLFTDPARGEVDMVFQFEHVNLDQGATKWDVRPLRLTDLKATFGRWQEGLAETGWNSLYWNNHDQPRVVSRFGDDGPEHRVRSAKMLATVLHLHRGTPYVYQGEELGMTNARFDRIEAFRDIESLNHYAEAVARGDDRGRGARRPAHDGPRQRAHADAVGRERARRLHQRRAVDPRQPELRGDQRRGRARRPRLRLPPLPAADRAAPRRAGRRARRLHDAAAGRRARLRVHAPARRRRAARARELLRRGRGRSSCREAGGELVLGNYADAGEELVLRPWEARVLRRTA